MRVLPVVKYHRPTTLAEALAIRAAGPVVIMAGGTDLYPARAARVGWGDPTQADVLDITAIAGLDRIEETPEGWRIGCLVTWTRLAAAPLPALFDGLRAAAREIGGRQVQNRGTLVGNICTASPAGDGIPNLLALDAAVVVAGPHGERMLPLTAFSIGYRRTALAPEEIVVALQVPRLVGGRGGFVKLGARRYLVISIVMASAVIVAASDGRIGKARLAVGACSAVARRLPLLETALLGVPLQAASTVPEAAHVVTLTPIDDIRASAAYRADVVVTLLRDLLTELAG